jgi:hypothetical protein
MRLDPLIYTILMVVSMAPQPHVTCTLYRESCGFYIVLSHNQVLWLGLHL